MLRNYLVVAWRNLLRQKAYSLIQVSGLAVGLACCLVIGQYVRFELSFDAFHEKGDRIYRFEEGGSPMTSSGYAPALQKECPEIIHAVRLWYNGPMRLERDHRPVDASGFIWADEGFFDTFTFPLVRGDAATALSAPLSIVLTESSARSIFGEADPMGQVLRWVDRFDLTVTGVAQDPPPNTVIRFRYIASFASLPRAFGHALDDFTNYNYHTYLLLPEGCRPAPLEARLAGLGHRHGHEEARATLQPLRAIYFDTSSPYDIGPKGSRRSLWVFSAIGVIVLLMACANAVNLATARSARRAREVSLRRTLGAVRGQLAGQFLGESVLLTLAAAALAAGLAELATPLVHSLAGEGAVIHLARDPGMLAALLGSALAVGLLAGSYPALYLSRFAPASAMRGRSGGGRGSIFLRRVLIAVQFTITIGLLICTLVVRKQFRYMQEEDLGFQGDQVVVTWLDGHLRGQYETLRNEVLRLPGVQQVSLTNSRPGSIRMQRGFNWPGEGDEQKGRGIYSLPADPYTMEVLGLQLAAGRNLSAEIPSDAEHAYLLNETAVRELGWTDPIGHPFWVWDRKPGQVVGVVRDFHFKSLHYPIEPLVFYIHPQWCNNVLIRISPKDVRGTLAAIKETWDRLSPEYAFNYTFLNEEFGRAYEKEERLERIFGVFFALAVGVACLGLLGLASYAAERRTREVGIRKVLGASVAGVTALLAGEFTWLVLAANLAAWPLAWLAMQRWLADFAYRTEVGLEVFVLSAVLALLTAWLTVGGQAVRAALANPVEALRQE